MTDRPGNVRSYRKTYRWTKQVRQEVLRRDRVCRGCGDAGSDGKGRGLHLAHLIDHQDGGPDTAANLVLLCPRCHRLFDAPKQRARKAGHA